MQSLSFLLKLPFLLPLKCWLPKIQPHLDGVYICPWFEYQNQFISCIEEEALSLSVFTIVFVFFFCCCHIFDPSLYCLSPFLPVLCHCFIAMSLGGIMPLQVLRIQLLTLWDPISTYKFSKLIFIYFLKEWVERIW